MLTRNRSSSSISSFSDVNNISNSRRRDENSTNENFKVVIRVRPPLPREMNVEQGFVNIVKVDEDKMITISENLAIEINRKYIVRIISLLWNTEKSQGKKQQEQAPDGSIYSSHSFTFDHVYDQNSRQVEVYNNTARDAVHSTLAGYNATIIAYGQTGTGKTYTMEGQNGFTNNEERGIIPRATEDIFNCKIEPLH